METGVVKIGQLEDDRKYDSNTEEEIGKAADTVGGWRQEKSLPLGADPLHPNPKIIQRGEFLKTAPGQKGTTSFLKLW